MILTVFDNFIKDETLLSELEDIDSFFKDAGEYKYWKGWWAKEPASLEHRLINYIFNTHWPLDLKNIMNLQTDGFEYWKGLYKASKDNKPVTLENSLENHLDDDVNYRRVTGKTMFPILGCVYYPKGFNFEGGELALYENNKDTNPEIIKAKPNRLIIFRPGQTPHAVLPVTKGSRGAIAINIWAEEPWSVANGYITLE